MVENITHGINKIKAYSSYEGKGVAKNRQSRVFDVSEYAQFANAFTSWEIDKPQFNQLIKKYIEDFLAANKYYERLDAHRNPAQVKQDTIRDLASLIGQIQQRPAMRDIDPLTNAHSYVTTVINDLFCADKSLRLYAAARKYCGLRGKHFNEIAPHIAGTISLPTYEVYPIKCPYMQKQ